MRRSVALGLAASLVVLGARGAAGQDEQIGLPVGATPPAVTIEDLDGAPVDLGQYLGKRPMLVEFWATWCPLCDELLPRLAAAHRQYGDRVAFVAIAVAVNQSQRSIRRHLERHPLPFQVLWDAGGRAVRAFQAPTTSYVVLLDAAGRVAYTGAGGDQDIEGALARVAPSSAR